MPIIGLTDRTPSFKEIGRLRLGIPKSEMTKGPKEIPYFRIDMRPEEGESLALFVAAYGGKPTSIRVRLPFAEIARCWDANYEVYNTSGMLGMADGERWVYLRDNKTGALIVKDGVPQEITPACKIDASGRHYLPFDKTVPVFAYKNNKGQDVAVFAKPKGRLQVVVPELKRAAYLTMITNSIYNVINLSAELAGIDAVAKQAGLTLPFVPMLLTRRLDTISVTIGGKKSMQQKYLCHLEIDPEWMAAQVTYLDGIKPGMMLPAARPAPVFELPAIIEGEDTEGEDFHEPDDMEDVMDYPMEPEPVIVEQPATIVFDDNLPEMSLVDAMNVTNKEGVLYGNLESDKLAYMGNSLRKIKREGKATDEHLMKLSAIQTILADRSGSVNSN